MNRVAGRTLSAVAGITLGLALAGQAGAVHVNPRGTGQVLLYPYYTVNKDQQTYVTLVNTTGNAKVAQVSFREGRNSRTVLDFKVFLSPFDVWAGTVFALEDVAGEGGDGAAVLTSDRSCTSPSFWTGGHGMINGSPYARFISSSFENDGGPQGSARTREGHIEIVALADLTGSLADAVTHRNGVPVDCARVANLNAPTAEMVPPGGGLLGSGAVINVGQGTYFSFRADALDDFTSRTLITGLDVLVDPLGEVNDAGSGNATARVFTSDGIVEARYGGDTPNVRIDAVSAVLMADMLYNDYLVEPAIGASSDWVITFPSKRFYTDPFAGAGDGPAALPPFVELFDEGASCIQTQITYYDREETTVASGGFPGIPPAPLRPRLCYGANVLTFGSDTSPDASAVLGSRLVAVGFGLDPAFKAGSARLDLDPDAEPHALRPSLALGGAGSSGKVFHGLPAIGFWATNLVNNNVADGVMSNYSAAVPHATRVTCTVGGSGCQ